MKTRARDLAAAALLLVACRRNEPAHAPAAPPVARPDTRATETDGGRDAAPDASPSDDAGGAAVSPGEWIESSLYRLRLEQLQRCALPDPQQGRRSTWLGVLVRVEAKSAMLFVSGRDFALQKDGIILEATYLDAPALSGCSRLLPQKQLRQHQAAHGVVLFELLPSFQAGRSDPVLVYHPTRWGGAGAVEVKLPRCIPDCPETPAGKKPPRNPARAHKAP
jgi:hypothetical protein